jgi:hypothetical protein
LLTDKSVNFPKRTRPNLTKKNSTMELEIKAVTGDVGTGAASS